MKRLFSLTLCVALAACLGAGLAEATEALHTAMPDAEPAQGDHAISFAEADAGYAGIWVPFEDGFRLYLPASWRSFDLTDAQREAGLFYRAGEAGMGVAVSYFPAGALKTLADLEVDLAAAGFTGLEQLDVNGIPAVGFERGEEDCRGAAFYHPAYPGYVLAVYVTPLGANGTPEAAQSRAILASLSPWQVEAEEPAQ